jgi:DegV family protein with EDD domain
MGRRKNLPGKNRVAVITDSIACLAKDLIEQYGIEIVPLNFYAEGKVYRDWIDVTPSEAYKLFLRDPESFKTSAVSPGDCLQAYRRISQKTREIVCITLSSKLSAVYDIFRAASEQFQSEFPETTIEVMDSRTAAAAEGLIVLAAARAAAQGKSLADVLRITEEVRDKVTIVAVMDTVRYIYRSGRMPKIAAVAGSMLNIKPVFTFSSGVPHFIGPVRNKDRGVERLLKLMRKKVGRNQVHVAVMHVYDQEEAERLKEMVSAEFNCAELWLTEFSPLMGYACGTGTLGLAFYSDD